MNDTNRNEMPAPFELARNFVSMNGTGRTCEAQQGWMVTSPVGMWGGSMSDSWSRTKIGAVMEAWKRYDDAHTEEPETLLGRRIGYVDWLLKLWPGAPAATKALELWNAQCEQQRQEREAEAQRKVELTAAAMQLLNNDNFRTALNELKLRKFERGEIKQIVTEALEGI